MPPGRPRPAGPTAAAGTRGGAWQWAAQSAGSSHTEVLNIAVDTQGNSYVVGFFTEAVQFGATALRSHGRSDLFVAKLSPAGRWEWAVGAGEADSDRAAGVAVDASGRVFVAGSFTGQLRLGAATLASQGEQDVFVAQISDAGQWQWATAAGGAGADQACALALSSAGELVVAGQFAATATFGPQALSSRGSTDAFVARLTRGGTWQWATGAGGGANDEASALSINAAGEIYVTGYFSDVSTFGATTLRGQGLDDAFVGKLTSAGRWLWATAATGSNAAYGKSIVADPTGGVFVAGSFSGTAAFGATQLRSDGDDDGFVAHLSDGGQWQWTAVLVSEHLDAIAGIALDKTGKLYVAGTFSSTVQAGPFQLVSRGQQDLFVGYLSRTGAWLGLTAAGGPAADEARTVALAPGGEVCVGGTFSTAATFGAVSLQAGPAAAQAYIGRASVPQPQP